jgi:hypothetical protein
MSDRREGGREGGREEFCSFPYSGTYGFRKVLMREISLHGDTR